MSHRCRRFLVATVTTCVAAELDDPEELQSMLHLASAAEEGAPRLRVAAGDVRPEGEEGWVEPDPVD